eukprot:TRINITY_DN16323_c0_g1_i2.p1 TRINITY_DN16323_c0_g1~~TRINITY_DN16323_c0_g1_i2.p1  ORF type:complete len:239 (-),score=45.46 TRINITY_DN16323_c0_g1_i2:24-740(-)
MSSTNGAENLVWSRSITEQVPAYLKEDLFHHFPDSLRPSPLCLIMGGSGARSDLHADPFAWTGWNVLLEGRKVWRFYPNTSQNAESAFGSKRIPFGIPDASSTDFSPPQFCSVAASWKSEVDVFADVSPAPTGTDLLATRHFSPDFSKHPDARKATPALEYVQMPGEVLVFPGHCFHQTYHLERSLGFAGQVLNAKNLRRVMEHIIDWCQLSTPEESFWSLPSRAVILQTLGEAIDSM